MTYRPWMRHPRTTAERRANQDEWARPKRRPHLLPNTYDDIWVRSSKSWKEKRKKQYYTGGRGKHHHVRIDKECLRYYQSAKIDLLVDYFKDYDIPYRIDVYHKFRWVERFNWEWDGTYETITLWEDYSYKRKVHKKKYTGEFYRQWYIDYYVVHWWYDKDIGLDFILHEQHERTNS